MSIHLSDHSSNYPSVQLSVQLSVRPSFCPSIHLSIHPSIRPSAHLSFRPSVYLSIYLSVHPHCVWVIICAARNCAQRMWPQVTGSNPLSDSIIFLSVHLSVCPQAFCNLCFCINLQYGDLAPQYIYTYMLVSICAKSLYVYGHHHTGMGTHTEMVIFLTPYEYH